MAQEFEEQEYFVLHLLSVSAEPLGAGSIREELAKNGMDPVSYTHLDVYKRQSFTCFGIYKGKPVAVFSLSLIHI